MRIKVLLILIISILGLNLFAQTPDWQWATQAGGSGRDRGHAIALDDNGNKYVTGRFETTSVFGSHTLVSGGNSDIFVAKMDEEGNWIWATRAGGNYSAGGYAISIDDNGNSYVTGLFWGAATFGSYTINCDIQYPSIFVAKIDANGNWLWATQAGGNNGDWGYGISTDDFGNSFVTGEFSSLTATFGSYSLTNNDYPYVCCFVAKIDLNGNWQWATKVGGSSRGIGYAITTDDNGVNYVTGSFSDTATFGTYSLFSNGGSDIFIAKIDADGSWLWATGAGGSEEDKGYAITIDDYGNSYVTGSFMGTATFGNNSLTSSGDRNGFVAKIDATGNWSWVNKVGGYSDIYGKGISVDENGNCYLTGFFSSTATFGPVLYLISSGGPDVFIAKINASGNCWQWAIKVIGSGSDSGWAIKIDNDGNKYVTGHFGSSASFGSYLLTGSGDLDIFVAKLGSETLVENEIIPIKMELSNYPNPFNPTTTISFSIQEASKVDLSIYNIKGQKIKSLISDQIITGEHSIVWNGEDASGKKVGSGVYLYKLNVNGKTKAMKKCLLLK